MRSRKSENLTDAYGLILDESKKPKRSGKKKAHGLRRIHADFFVIFVYMLLFFAGIVQLGLLASLDIF